MSAIFESGYAAMCLYMPFVGALRMLKSPERSCTATAASSAMPTATAGTRTRLDRSAAATAGASDTARTACSAPSHESRNVTETAPSDAPSRSAK